MTPQFPLRSKLMLLTSLMIIIISFQFYIFSILTNLTRQGDPSPQKKCWYSKKKQILLKGLRILLPLHACINASQVQAWETTGPFMAKKYVESSKEIH